MAEVAKARVSPRREDAYWRANFKSRPYVRPDVAYKIYRPAYKYGWESRVRFAGRRWEDVATDLRVEWEKVSGQSTLTWEEAGQAAQDAWNRITLSA
ncbi:MAG TPA: hypothetical protein VE967_00510 [Gemmatimonadaceae bacterium]|nr:hypothetical protein [Gemmatimonadaceae bacterium]